MYHCVPLSSSDAHTNFPYNYLENSTMNFVENYIVLKLKCCIMYLEIITQNLGYRQKHQPETPLSPESFSSRADNG